MTVHASLVSIFGPLWDKLPSNVGRCPYVHGMNTSTVEDFAVALGVEVQHTEPDDTCATRDSACASFEPDTNTLRVCRMLCPGRRQLAMSLVLERL